VSRAVPGVRRQCLSAFSRDLPGTFSRRPVARIDLPHGEPESGPEICRDVAVQSQPDDVPVRVDLSQPETVDQHDTDDVAIVATVVTVAALAWLIVRRSYLRRR
jgi:hypothetical protein